MAVSRRRLLMLGGALAAAPLASFAQPKLPRVAYVFPFREEQTKPWWDACRRGLHELGYEEGKNIALEPRWNEGDPKKMKEQIDELVASKIDVIVAATQPAAAIARAVTSTTPIVFVAVSDPVRLKLVASMTKPGRNMTGLAFLAPDLSGDRVRVLKELMPQLLNLTVLSNPTNSDHKRFLEETGAAARSLGIQLNVIEVLSEGDVDSAFETGSGAILVLDDVMLWRYRRRAVLRSAQRRVPVMYGDSDFVREGGFASYGPSRIDLYRRSAEYVDKILKGARPAQIPVEGAKAFELAVNVRVAKTLGIEIPETMLQRAEEVIR
jgi:putative tryptophan/tyrosine transport system substrate-binding protein